MRKLVVIGCLLVAAVAAPAGAITSTDDPFPAGACVRVTVFDPRPVCVIIDPAASAMRIEQVTSASSDAQLVTRSVAGDREAFRHLFERHRGSVASVCRQQLGSEGEVDDAVQEAFARALARLPQLRDPATFGSWVRAIATRICIDHHRVASRVTVVAGDLALEVVDVSPRPDEVAEAQERSASVRASLQSLGARDRRALWLRHVSEASVAAVADELGLTEGSTRVMLARARKRLRAAAGGVGVLVPLSWRQWLRNLVSTPNPAFDLAAVAVAMTIAAGAGAAISEPPQAPPLPDSGVVTVHSEGPKRHAEDRPAVRRPEATRRRHKAATPVPRTATDAGTGQSASPAARITPRRPLVRVDRPVHVRREYPNQEETDEIVDIRVFSGDEEGDVRLYADDVTSAVGGADEQADAALDGL